MSPCTDHRRIAIVLTGAMGDCIRLMTCLKHCKQIPPGITWFIGSKWSDLCELEPRVSYELVGPGITNVLRVIRNIRRFDLALDMQRIFKSGILSFALGYARVGFHPKDTKEFNHMFNNVYIPEWRDAQTKLEKYCEFLKIAGIYPDILEEPTFRCSTEVALVLGGSWSSKRMGVRIWKDAIKTFQRAGFNRFYLLGGNDTLETAKELHEFCSNLGIYSKNLAGSSLKETIDFCRQFEGIGFGGDTGVAHLFAFFTKPYIPVFGPSDPTKNAPVKMAKLTLTSDLICAPCERRRCYFGTNFCLSVASAKLKEEILYKIVS